MAILNNFTQTVWNKVILVQQVTVNIHRGNLDESSPCDNKYDDQKDITDNKYARIHLVVWFGKEGNVLFNDALNTFYLRLYGVRHNNGKGPLR